MKYKVFTINAEHGDCDEMNAFLNGKKIVEVEKHFYTEQNAAFWSFCISYLEEVPSSQQQVKREKTDYKDILDEKEFERFASLREMRKTIANSEGVPVYAVFTNEELASIAKLQNISKKSLQSINGIGEKRIEKYGDAVIETLSTNNQN